MKMPWAELANPVDTLSGQESLASLVHRVESNYSIDCESGRDPAIVIEQAA